MVDVTLFTMILQGKPRQYVLYLIACTDCQIWTRFIPGLYHIMETINKFGLFDHVELCRIQDKLTKEKVRLYCYEVDGASGSVVQKNNEKHADKEQL